MRPYLRTFGVGVGTAAAIFLGAGIFGAVAVHVGQERDAWRCTEGWKESRVQSKYVNGVGCLVEIDAGTWIPETAFWTWKIGRHA